MTIKIYFCDFWDNYDPYRDLPYNILKNHYEVEVVDKVSNDTDLIIYSCFGFEHLSYNGVKKLYISGENDYPNYNQCDYAITHTVFENQRHIRVPLWVFHLYREHQGEFVQTPNLDKSFFNRKFCADVISNNQCAFKTRFKVIDVIGSKYKPVDHGGKINNNVGGPVGNKIEFLSNYKFSIAAENSIVDGYVTEKIYDSYMANTIPIYIGTPTVIDDFNADSFINVSEFNSYSKLIARLSELDNDEDLYMEALNASRMATNDTYNRFFDKMSSFLMDVIENGKVYNHLYGRIGLMNSRYMYF